MPRDVFVSDLSANSLFIALGMESIQLIKNVQQMSMDSLQFMNRIRPGGVCEACARDHIGGVDLDRIVANRLPVM